MESTWDIVFACKTEFINRIIREQKTAFLGAFNYKNGMLCAEIPAFQIGWSGNEQYMAVELTLRNVRINVGGITEEHDRINSMAHLQFCFKDEHNVGFVCKTLAEQSGDVQFPGKDAVSGKPECNEEMDTEIPELGPSAEPADCPVWGTAHGISVNKKTGMAASKTPAIPTLFLRHLYYCQKIPVLFQRPGVGSAHGNGNKIQCLFAVQKNQKKCIEFTRQVIL